MGLKSSLHKKLLANTIVALAAAICITIFIKLAFPLYESFESKTFDLRFQMRGPISERNDIVFIEMDEPSIEVLGRWPWPRNIFAGIITALNQLQAKAILFDVTFTERTQLIVDKESLRDNLRLEETSLQLRDFIDQTKSVLNAQTPDIQEVNSGLDQLKLGVDLWKTQLEDTISQTMLDNDLTLAEAIQKAANVYLGYHFEVIYTAEDISKDRTYTAIKSAYAKWLERNPTGNFSSLPAWLKTAPDFKNKGIYTVFRRSKLQKMLKNNPSLSFPQAKQSFSPVEVKGLLPLYTGVKNEFTRQVISAQLHKNPQADFAAISWPSGLLSSSEDITMAEKEFAIARLLETFARKVSLPELEKPFFLKAIKVSPPIFPFTRAMKSAGYLNAIADQDGTLRKVPLFVSYAGRIYPHIALRFLIDLWKIDPSRDIHLREGKFIDIGTHRIPIDQNGYMLVNWAGKWRETFNHLSAYEIYNLYLIEQNIASNLKLSEEELANGNRRDLLTQDQKKRDELIQRLAGLIKDKICIIGLTAAGTHDYTPIPLESDYPAVGTHANILNTILEKKFLYRADMSWTIITIFVLAGLSAIFIGLLPPLGSFIATFLAIILYAVLSFVLLRNQGLWIDLTGPLASALLSYLGIVSYNFATEEKEKRWIRRAFGHYISKNILEEILKDPAKLHLGGERKELTILFADVKGFTTYSEKRSPEEVVAILNEYFQAMTQVIFQHGGTLDKYVGDEIMAVFGAPSTTLGPQECAKKAVVVAMEMIRQLKILQAKWKSENKEPLDIGIGINTGIMLVGNMGSSERMDYTVIGDAVNLGSRIEDLTRTYNNHIIISEFTYAYVKDFVGTKQLEAIQVRGRKEPVMVYEVIGPK